MRLAPGTLYEALSRLEGQGLIEALESQDRRRPYQLTAAGAAALRAHLADQRRVAEIGLGAAGPDLGHRRDGSGPRRSAAGSGPPALLRWYPRGWRARYGDEFAELLLAELAERPRGWRRTADVVAERAARPGWPAPA